MKSSTERTGAVGFAEASIGVEGGVVDSETAVVPVSNAGDCVTAVGEGEGIALWSSLTVWTQSRTYIEERCQQDR